VPKSNELTHRVDYHEEIYTSFFFRYFNWEDGAEIMEMKKKKAKKKKF
jgi:hypothetical protein